MKQHIHCLVPISLLVALAVGLFLPSFLGCATIEKQKVKDTNSRFTGIVTKIEWMEDGDVSIWFKDGRTVRLGVDYRCAPQFHIGKEQEIIYDSWNNIIEINLLPEELDSPWSDLPIQLEKE